MPVHRVEQTSDTDVVAAFPKHATLTQIWQSACVVVWPVVVPRVPRPPVTNMMTAIATVIRTMIVMITVKAAEIPFLDIVLYLKLGKACL